MKGKPDGGQGGKLGHSNMDHWVYTEEIKEASRKRRRLVAKAEIIQGLAEEETAPNNEPGPVCITNEFSK